MKNDLMAKGIKTTKSDAIYFVMCDIIFGIFLFTIMPTQAHLILAPHFLAYLPFSIYYLVRLHKNRYSTVYFSIWYAILCGSASLLFYMIEAIKLKEIQRNLK